MPGSQGLAGLAVTALVAALVAFGVAALLGGPAAPPAPVLSSPAPAGDGEVARLRGEVARLREDLARVRRDAPPAGAGAAAAPPEEKGGPTADPSSSTGDPSAPLPATRGELVTLIDARIFEKGLAGIQAAPPKRKVSVDDACGEMGLSSVETDSVKRVLREAETELIVSVMGTADLDAVKEEIRGVKEDPDAKAALVQKAVGNMIRNAGRLVTLEDRRDRELKRFLTPDQVKKLREYDLKSLVADEELEGILEDVFGK